jgi:hypothetical protein
LQKTRVLLVVLSLVAAQSLSTLTSVHGTSSLLRVIPPPTEITTGQAFTVTIAIQDIVTMAAYEFKVSWDTAFVEYVTHTHTPPSWSWIPSDQLGDGALTLAAVQLAPPYFTGNTSLATIMFTALQSGDTDIHLSEALVADGYATPIPIITEDAAITILPPEHDIAIANLIPAKRVIGQGYPANISVTAVNPGDYPETFTVSLYANDTLIDQQTTALAADATTTLTFTWTTIDWTKGNYSMWTYAAPVTGETHTDDNTFLDGWIVVTLPGDVDGDGDIDIFDLVKIAQVYGTVQGHMLYTARCDINDDSVINVFDLVLAAANYGERW